MLKIEIWSLYKAKIITRQFDFQNRFNPHKKSNLVLHSPHFLSPFLSLITSLLPYSHWFQFYQTWCNVISLCDNIYSNLFYMFEMIHLSSISYMKEHTYCLKSLVHPLFKLDWLSIKFILSMTKWSGKPRHNLFIFMTKLNLLTL